VTPLLLVTIAGILLLHNAPRTVFERSGALLSRVGLLPQVALLAAALLVTDVMAPEGVAPFVYFGF
jgi:hypothetical protein